MEKYNNTSNVTINGVTEKDFIHNKGHNVTINAGSGADTLMNYGNSVIANGDDGNDYIENYGINVILAGGKGNDTIINREAIEDSSIKGSAQDDYLIGEITDENIFGYGGNDTLDGEKGNDTLIGGSGADVFIYKSGDGNDVITDYTYGQDIIKLGENLTISEYVVNDQDAIIKFNEGTILLKDVEDSIVTVIDSSGNTFSCTSAGIYRTIAPGVVSNIDTTIVTINSDYDKKTLKPRLIPISY